MGLLPHRQLHLRQPIAPPLRQGTSTVMEFQTWSELELTLIVAPRPSCWATEMEHSPRRVPVPQRAICLHPLLWAISMGMAKQTWHFLMHLTSCLLMDPAQ